MVGEYGPWRWKQQFESAQSLPMKAKNLNLTVPFVYSQVLNRTNFVRTRQTFHFSLICL